jgi:hypothetical protein
MGGGGASEPVRVLAIFGSESGTAKAAIKGLASSLGKDGDIQIVDIKEGNSVGALETLKEKCAMHVGSRRPGCGTAHRLPCCGRCPRSDCCLCWLPDRGLRGPGRAPLGQAALGEDDDGAPCQRVKARGRLEGLDRCITPVHRVAGHRVPRDAVAQANGAAAPDEHPVPREAACAAALQSHAEHRQPRAVSAGAGTRIR